MKSLRSAPAEALLRLLSAALALCLGVTAVAEAAPVRLQDLVPHGAVSSSDLLPCEASADVNMQQCLASSLGAYARGPLGVNPQLYSGSDFGAQAAAALSGACVALVGCKLSAPFTGTLQSFSTGVALGNNQSVDCLYAGGYNYGTNLDNPVPLSYTGTGTAITLNAHGNHLEGCGLVLGTGAAAGVKVTGGGAGHNSVGGLFMSGGGAGTKFFNVSNASDYRISNSDIFATGAGAVGFYLTQSNDTFIVNDVFYGAAVRNSGTPDVTTIPFVFDSHAYGNLIDDVGGGFAGLHAMVMQNVANVGLGPPAEFDIKSFYGDCSSGGSGLYLDASLGTTGMRSVMSQSWLAGAGQDCNNATTVVTANAHGVEFEGGAQFIMYGMRLRANTGAGYYDNTAGLGNILALSYVGANCIFSVGCTHSGAEYTAAATGFINLGNWYDNSQDVGPSYQAYGVSVSTASGGYGIVANNACGTQVSGCVKQNEAAGAKVAYFDNLSAPGSVDPPNKIFGDLKVSSDGSRVIGAHVVPSYGSSNNFLAGVTTNLAFNAANSLWTLDTDGGTNGGAGWLLTTNPAASGAGAYAGFYLVPSTGATAQTVSPSALAADALVSFPGGVWTFDQPISFLASPSLKNGLNAAEYLFFQAGASANQTEGLQFKNYTGTAEWQVWQDSSLIFHIGNVVANVDHFWASQGAQSIVQSEGSTDVQINSLTGSGTGGFSVYSGGATPTKVASISGSGAASLTSATVTGLTSAGCLSTSSAGLLQAGCSGGSTGTASNLAGGAVGSAPYQSAAGATAFIASPTAAGTYVEAWQPSGAAIAPAALNLATYLASPPAIGGTAPAAVSATTLAVTTDGGTATFGDGTNTTTWATFGGVRTAVGFNAATGSFDIQTNGKLIAFKNTSSAFGGTSSGFEGLFDASGNFGVGTANNPTFDPFYVTSAGAVTAASLSVNGTAVKGDLVGTSSSIGGGALAAGACASTTVSITGAATTMAVAVTPVADPGAGNYWQGFVSSANTVTVRVCAAVAGTPTAETYNVRVIQ